MGKARSRKQDEEKLRYKPMSFDIDKIVPDAAEGEYNAIVDQATIKTNRAQVPMLTLVWQIKSTNTKTKAAEKSVKGTVTDRISFFPDGDKRGNFGRRQLKQLLDALNIKVNDVMPRKLTGDDEEDFADLLKALKKKKLTIWVTNKEDQSGEMRANVFYTEPRGFMADSVDDEEEEEEDDEEDDSDDEEDEDSDDEDEDEKPSKKKKSKKDDDSDEEDDEEDDDSDDEDSDDEEDEDEEDSDSDDDEESEDDDEDEEEERPKKKKKKSKR